MAERAFRFLRQRQRPMGAFTNEESAERMSTYNEGKTCWLHSDRDYRRRYEGR